MSQSEYDNKVHVNCVHEHVHVVQNNFQIPDHFGPPGLHVLENQEEVF